jgi:hypothetical protein
MMKALKVLVVVMGVLIVAGVVVLVVAMGQRLSGPKLASPGLLDEPAGTHITQISASGDRLTLLLQGGGPDRVVVVDLHQGQVMLRTGLAH